MYRSLLRGLALGVVVTSLISCTTSGGPSVPRDGARQPISAQTPVGDAHQRAKIHTELGSLYLQDNRFAVALEEARIAIKAAPNYAPAYNLLGLTHMLMNEQKLAEENFGEALRYAPGDPEIFNTYGWFLCQTGREKQSLEYFLASARNPLYQTPSKPLANAGICAIRLKDTKAGEDYLVRALKLDSGNTTALYWLAELAYRQGRYAEARQSIADLEKATELPADATWLALRIERKLGNRDGEARQTGRLKRVFPTSAETRKLQQGDYE